MEELAEDTKYFAIKAGLTSKANRQLSKMTKLIFTYK